MPRHSSRLNESESVQRCGWPGCQAACCVYGTWVEEGEQSDILGHADLIRPLLPLERRDASHWFERETGEAARPPRETLLHTRVVADPDHYGGSSCVFLLPDYRCALQAAGEAAGEHPWRFKPVRCILHPLELDAQGRVTLDAVRFLVDEPASCLRPAKGAVALRELFAEELDYLTIKRET